MPYAHYDPDSSSWRTSQLSLLEDSTSSSVTFTKAGSMRSGRLYERPTLVQRTGVNVSSSSLMPTPQSRDYKGVPADGFNQSNLVRTVERMLPTAVVTDSFGARNRTSGRSNPDSNHHDGVTLNDWIRLLPTARSTDGPKGGPGQVNGRGIPDSLPAIGALLPTPVVNDMGEGKTPEKWDAWTEEMRSRHTNGNGHGKSLAIEAQRLLPTPSSADGTGGRVYRDDFCSTTGKKQDGTKTQVTLAHAIKLTGAISPLPSDGGNEPSDGPLPLPLWTDD